MARGFGYKQSTERNRLGSIRFGSGLLNNSSVRFGSVRTNIFPGSTRFGLRFSDASWLGPIRFGSFARAEPVGSRIERFGSVRLGSVRFGSYSCSRNPRGCLSSPNNMNNSNNIFIT